MNAGPKITTRHKIKIWEGAFILSIAGLITKLLSAIYRIPFQNIAGDIGFYIYQQVYPIYGIALIFSTYGFPVVISKMVAERLEQQDEASARKILFVAFIVLLIVGFILFSLLFFKSSTIAVLMGDNDLALLIKVISFSFLLLPFISILRGYFQGKRNMKPTAVSQVFEQLVRVLTILAFAYILLKSGFGIYEVGAGAIFGSITGGIAAIVVLSIFFLRLKGRDKVYSIGSGTIRVREILKVLLGQGITICVSSLLLILIQLVDSFSMYSLLVTSGMDEEVAKLTKGIYDRGQPLIQLGTVVATSISLAIVPLISSAKMRRDLRFIHNKINLSIRVSIVVGIGAAVGLACIIRPTNIMLFQDQSGSTILMLLALSILFTSLTVTVAAILQGLGSPLVSAIIILAGMVVKGLANVLLIPTYHAGGAAVSTILSLFVVAILHLIALRAKVQKPIITWSILKIIIKSTIIMTVIIVSYVSILTVALSPITQSRGLSTFIALSAVAIGGCTYLFFIIRGRVFTENELMLIPLGNKVNQIVKRKEGVAK